MKKIIALIFSIIISFNSFGITEYKPGDELYIWAESGLNLRKKPDFKSDILTKIPFRKKVICKGRKSWYQYEQNSLKIIDKVKISDEKISKIEMKGNWVEISFEGFEGYVFDAYLSRFKPFKKNENFTSLIEYFKKVSDPLVYLEGKDSTLEYGRDKIVFGNGIFLSQNYSSSVGWYQMNVPNFSKEEAFLITHYLDKYAIDIIQKESDSIIFLHELGERKIESFKDIVIISGEWGC